jgi:hypothetical protein
MSLHITTRKGIRIDEIDTAKYAKDKFLFNITQIPHDYRRPDSIDIEINGIERIFQPADGWTQVAFEAEFGPNKIVFKNLDIKPITYEPFVRYKRVYRTTGSEILDWKKEHKPHRHKFDWQSLATH